MNLRDRWRSNLVLDGFWQRQTHRCQAFTVSATCDTQWLGRCLNFGGYSVYLPSWANSMALKFWKKWRLMIFPVFNLGPRDAVLLIAISVMLVLTVVFHWSAWELLFAAVAVIVAFVAGGMKPNKKNVLAFLKNSSDAGKTRWNAVGLNVALIASKSYFRNQPKNARDQSIVASVSFNVLNYRCWLTFTSAKSWA